MPGEAITHEGRDFTPNGASPRPEICSCGHPPTPQPDTIIGGYARVGGRTMCLDCATRAEIGAFNDPTTDRWFAYLTPRVRPVPPGVGERDEYALTTWLGTELAFVRSWRVETRRTPSGGYYDRVYFTAIDAQGRRWYGTSPGVQMYARMHLAKGRS